MADHDHAETLMNDGVMKMQNEPADGARSPGMNRLTLSFSDPSLERDFLDDYSDSILPRVRIALVLGFFLYAGFGLLDALIIPDIRQIAWVIRFAFVCPFLAAVYVSTYYSWFRKIMQAAIASSVFVSGIGIVLMIESASTPAEHSYYGGLILVIMFAFILSGLRFVNATGTSAAILIAYVFTTMLHDRSHTVFHINNYFFFISSFVIGMFSGYLVERHVRHNFIQRRSISGMVGELKLEVQERKAALDTLQMSEEKYHALMENAGDAIVVIDPSGNLLEANRQAEELFGCSKEDLAGMNAVDLHPPDEREKVKEAYLEVRNMRRYSLSHTWVHGKDGRRVPVDLSANTVYYGDREAVIASFRNITPYRKMEETLRSYQEGLEGIISERTDTLRRTVEELRREVSDRRNAEETLRRNKLFLNSIFDNIMDGITVIDADLNILLVNRTVETWYQHKMPIRFKEKKCFEVFHDRDCECEECPSQLAMRSGSPHMKTFSGSINSGRRVGLEIYAFPFRDDRGCIIGAVEYVRDVTARLEAEESACRTHHLAQLGQLSAGIAHEINNPNSVIMCSGQILNDIWEDAAKVLLRHYAEYGDFLLGGRPFSESASKVNDTIKAVIRCSRRIDDIVVNLKDYAGNRKTAVNEYFNLNTAVMNALLITAGLTKKHTDRLMTDLCSDLPPVHGSVSAIEQVVVNLLTNAVYALPDRTHGIHVSTAWEPSSGKVVLKVKDEGLGMTEDVRNKIYEPFFTTRFDSGGTGLGLSIAHTIVSNHGGLLDLESEPGSGTVARLELPAAEVDSPSEERGEHQG